MAENVSASGTHVINYNANASGTPVINYAKKNMQVTPTISRSAKKVGFTPSSVSRKSKQIETPLTKLKLGRFHTQANINKHKKQRASVLSERRARMDAKFAQQNAENEEKTNFLQSEPLLQSKPRYWLNKSFGLPKDKSHLLRITRRPGWRKRIENKKQFKKEKENYEDIIGVYSGSPKHHGTTMELLRKREGRGPLTANQRRHIEGAKKPRHMTATNYNDLQSIIKSPKYYVVGSTVSLETNAQGDPKIYIVVENERGQKEFVIMNKMNSYNGGTRRIRRKH